MNINWDEALAASTDSDTNEPVPPGSYQVAVNEATATVASTGSPMIKVKLEIVGGAHDKRWVWTNFVVKPDNPDSAKIFVRKIKAFGFTNDYLSAKKPSMEALAKELVGRKAIATVSIREYQGKKNNDVSKLEPLTAGKPGPAIPPPAPVSPPVTPPTTGEDPF